MRVGQREFLEAVQTATRAHSRAATLPILHGIFMQAAEGKLGLTCTDLDYWARCDVSCEGELTAVVSASVLLDIAKKLRGDIEITAKDSTVSVSCGSTRYELVTMPVEHFPLFPDIPQAVFKAPADTFRAIAQVAYAAEREGPHPYLQGVLLDVSDGLVTAVATDTFRLALVRVPVETQVQMRIIVPPRILQDAAKLVGTITCASDGKQLVLSCGDTTLVSRLLDGQFPAYERILSDDCAARITVESKALREALERISALKKDRGDIICLTLKDGLVLSTTAQDVGRAEETLPAEIEGEAEPVHLRRVYLSEALGAIPDGKISMVLPGGIKPVNLWAEHSRHLIMPVTVTV